MLSNILITFCYIFLAFLIIQNTYNTIFALISFVISVKQNKKHISFNKQGSFKYPPLSILVPVHNEQYTIIESVKSLLKVNYNKYEIIIINDGSSDNTLNNLIKEFKLKKTDLKINNVVDCKPIRCVYKSEIFHNILVVDKDYGGKSDALNCGINICKYDLFICLDGDTILEENALQKMVLPFIKNPKEVIAVGGTIRIINGSKINNGVIINQQISNKLLVLMRCISYIEIFNIRRISWSFLNGLVVLPGAFSIFKKSTVIEAGGYRSNTLTEDKELILRLHKSLRKQSKKYKIVHNLEACAWTQVPDTIQEVKKQRIRLQKGSIACDFLYKRFFLNPKYGLLGLITFPCEVIDDILDPLLKPTGYLLIITLLLFGKLDYKFILLFIYLEIIFRTLPTFIAIFLEKLFNKYKNFSILKFLAFSFIKNYFYEFAVNLWKIRGIIEYILNKSIWIPTQRKCFNQLK